MAHWTDEFISALAPPPYPAPIDKELAARGQAIFAAHCASCHDGKGSRVGTSIPLAEIGTDPEHVRTFSQTDADHMNTPDPPARRRRMPSSRARRAMSHGR